MTLLSVEGLGITFGGLKAVNEVSFKVKPGEIVSVIGPNGAGKTTLFNMISGVYRPDRGRVVLNGEDVTGMAPFRLAQRGMSRTFQNLQIFQNMTVLENAILGFHLQEKGSILADLFDLPPSRGRARHAAEGARRLLARVGLERAGDREAGNLSYGSLKRLEIARALATGARLLLLDEVMAGLIPTEVTEIVSIIRQIRDEGHSFLMIEHVMQAVMSLAETAYVLNHGKMIAQGTPRQLVRDPAVVEAYLGHGAAARLQGVAHA